MTTKTFADFELPEFLVKSLEKAGFTTPTPIQEKAIPAQMQGRDIMGIAQTGSGKTAAFSLPILANIFAMEGRAAPKTARALILAPTRELAVQIEEMIRLYASGRQLTTALVLGGVSRNAQIQKLSRGVDIIIATPGRMCDLYEDRKIRLDKVQYLVLDEADRMLDMGFIKPVRDLAAAVGKDRRTALFSATMAPAIEKLANSLLHNPVKVESAPQGSVVVKIEQQVILTGAKQKRQKLNDLLADDAMEKVILFARTKHGADKVAKNLQIDGHSVAAIHGNKSQNARQAALKGFRAGKVRILVATDIAARGIDVPDVTHVINYELPDDPENYVHRIGRTGRNGASGAAITLVSGAEKGKLRDIERTIRRTLPTTGELPEGEPGPSKQPQRGRSQGAPRHGAPKRNGGPNRNGAPKRNGGPRSGAPNRNGKSRPPNAGSNDGGGNAGWWAKLDGEEPKGDGAGKPKRPGGKKQRWNKGQKDAARANRENGGDRRGGGSSHAA